MSKLKPAPTARRCCLWLLPGADRVLQFVKPLMQYDRKGGLYVAKMKLTDFQRPAGN